jgi:DNA-binding transcriptional LysR family regulator
MDVQRLRILRELADRGSVTAVAAALAYTPSAISQQLKALTQEVGLVLTEPAGRGVRLTDAGHALVAEAEQVLAALSRAEAAVARLRSEPAGQVRMAIFQSGARMLLPGLLRRLDGAAGVDLSCRDVDMTPGDVAELAADYDLVVCHRDETAPAPSTQRWAVIPLLREPLDVFLPPGHPLRRRRVLRLSELAGEAWISVEVGWPVDDVLRSIAVQTGTAPRVVQRINDFSVTEELVAAGRGIALLPRYSTDCRSGRRLLRRPLAGGRAARLVEVVLRSSVAARPAVQAVVESLRTEADAVVAGSGR